MLSPEKVVYENEVYMILNFAVDYDTVLYHYLAGIDDSFRFPISDHVASALTILGIQR
jgi:hypothetical protein